MESDKKIVKKIILKDNDFIECYKKSKTKKSFESVIDELIEYCFYSEFNPYLEKKYLDYSWLENKENGHIVNMDDIYDVFKEILEE